LGNNPYAEGWFAYPSSDYSDKVNKKVKEKGDRAYTGEILRFAKEYPCQFIPISNRFTKTVRITCYRVLIICHREHRGHREEKN